MSIVFDPKKKIHEQITEETWCQGMSYQNANGSPTIASYACRACSEAWGYEIYGEAEGNDLRAKFREVNGILNVVNWNDAPERTFAEVHAAFQRANQ